MNPRTLRTWHRNIAIALAPFLLLQVLSGLFLSFGFYRRIGDLIEKQAPPPVTGAWNLLMAKLHYGPGLIGYVYHSLLSLAALWIIVSGVWIWFGLKQRQRKKINRNAKNG